MNARVIQTYVSIPAQKRDVLLQCLRMRQNSSVKDHNVELCQCLESYGWSAFEEGEGAVLLNGYRGRALDLAHDPVLNCLPGIVPAGNFLVGFATDEGNEEIPWYILYTASEKQIHYEQPSTQSLPALVACSACGSSDVQNWHYIEYTEIVYPVLSVNARHVRTSADVKEIQFESVIREYLECACGEEVSKGSRSIDVVP